MPVLTGTPLALPYYTNVAGAYADELPLNFNPSALSSGFKNDGATIVVPIIVCVIVIPSAVAGNRLLSLEVLDSNGLSVFIVPAAAVIGPSVGVVVNWLPSVSTPFALSTFQVAPLPAVQLLPGYVIHANIGSGQAGDVFQQVLIQAARFPTNLQPEPVAVVKPQVT